MASHQTRVRGLRLAYDDAGEGQPVVLLHGFPFNRFMWSGEVERLRATYRVITPDLRGHGETVLEDGAEASYGMDEMARDVAALLDELKIDRAVIGGLSLGGYVTFAFHRLFPLRVKAVILADTRPQADTEENKKAREQNAALALDKGMNAIADAMLPKLLTADSVNNRPELVASLRAMITGTSAEGAAGVLRGMAARRDHTDHLDRITAPTLIIVGSEDTVTPPADAELMRREIRGSRLVVIEGAGHVSNLEKPIEFGDALETFLNESMI